MMYGFIMIYAYMCLEWSRQYGFRSATGIKMDGYNAWVLLVYCADVYAQMLYGDAPMCMNLDQALNYL